ncbi:HIT domain-containing protein [Candidatus Woesearchaeota archaeon]|nr:MAG: HIT domain-containing protein [Candidatus Woesearchaeota archaeon]
MTDEASQEELLRRQKENCIFCKIIAGAIPAKKIYEDERIAAILDINPLAKGHTLVMPKEHYPIMPLIPPEEFAHLFGRTAPLTKAVKQGAVTKQCTIFIANGPLAGQQSPHFLFHIVPREDGDGLTNFSIPQRGINQSDIAALMKQNLYSAMREHLQRTGRVDLLQVGEAVSDEEAERINARAARQAAAASTPTTPPPAPPTHAQLAALIEANPELHALLLNNPEKLKAIVDERPEFQQLFAGVDIIKLGEQLRKQTGYVPPSSSSHSSPSEPPSPPPTPAPSQPAPAEREDAEREEQAGTPARAAQTADIKPARDMTLSELFTFIDGKERLKAYILNAPEKLKELIPNNKRLSVFFAGANIDAIIQAYRAYAQEQHEEGDA